MKVHGIHSATTPGSRGSRTFFCSEHAQNICEKLNTFYMQQQLDDIVVIANNDDTQFKAHRVVLAASSSYFFSMLHHSQKRRLNRAGYQELRVMNMDGIILESILGFIYTASIELHSKTVRRVLRGAELFQMEELITVCWDFLGNQLDASNCLTVLAMAEEQGCSELHREAAIFAYTNFDEVCNEDEFFQLSKDQLKLFVFGAEVSAEKVFVHIVSWVAFDRRSREQYLVELLSNVPFEQLDPKFIIGNRHMVCKTIECYELICSWLQWHVTPDSRPRSYPGPRHDKLSFVAEDLSFRTLEPDSEWPIWVHNQDIPLTLSKISTAINKSVIAIKDKLIIVGGKILSEASNNVDCFDLRTKVLSSLPPMNIARSFAGLAELYGNLYVIGGCQDDGEWMDSVEMFSFTTKTWQLLPPLSTPFVRIKVAVVNGLIYALGNNCRSMDCFNPQTKKWNRRSFNIEKSSGFGVAGVDGSLYVVGGSFHDTSSFTVERYDAPTNCWTVVTQCETRRSSVECVGLNDKLIVCEDPNDMWMLCNYVKEYNPRTNKWKSLDPMLHKGLKLGLITM